MRCTRELGVKSSSRGPFPRVDGPTFWHPLAAVGGLKREDSSWHKHCRSATHSDQSDGPRMQDSVDSDALCGGSGPCLGYLSLIAADPLLWQAIPAVITLPRSTPLLVDALVRGDVEQAPLGDHAVGKGAEVIPSLAPAVCRCWAAWHRLLVGVGQARFGPLSGPGWVLGKALSLSAVPRVRA